MARLEKLPEVFFTRFDEVRRARGETLGEMAARLGVEPGHLGRVLRGRRPGSALLFRALELELRPVVWAWLIDRGPRPDELAARS